MSDQQFGRHEGDEHHPHHDGMTVRDAYARLSATLVSLGLRVEKLSTQLHHVSGNLHHQLEKIMATQEELDAKVAEVTATLTTQFAEVRTEIQALKDQVAAGATINLDSFAGLDAAVGVVSDEVPDAPAAG